MVMINENTSNTKYTIIFLFMTPKPLISKLS